MSCKNCDNCKCGEKQKCKKVNGKQVYCDAYLIMFESMPQTLNSVLVCPYCGEDISELIEQDHTIIKAQTYRGHEISVKKGVWIYCDTKTLVSEDKSRSCGHCGKPQTPEGYDGCIGTIDGAMNACCGHGNPGEAYIQYSDKNRISGEKALRIIRANQEPTK